LTKVSCGFAGFARSEGFLDGWGEQSRQKPQDCHHHEEFHQGKGATAF
jgi:hypothetical protein